MIYGIDLGTTNSLIGFEDEFLTGLIPSVANLSTRTAGEKHRFDLKARRSFKPSMSMDDGGIIPIDASSLVLQELCNEAKKQGYDVEDVVISVPAKFNDNQRAATIEAAKRADLNVRGLVNEPTAAAIKVAKNVNALFLVFDLGGGTFDISVIDSRFDNYDVQDTDGIILGGDDFDKAIRQYFINTAGIKSYKQGKEKLQRLLFLATQSKIRIQKEQHDIEVNLSEFGAGTIPFTVETYVTIMKTVFSPTLQMTKSVIQRSIDFGETYKLIFVGGTTRCPYLKEWITKELGITAFAMDYDPDKVVAQGAALYAAMIEDGSIDEVVSDVTQRLSIRLGDGTTQTIIEKNSKIPTEEEELFVNQKDGDELVLDLYQGDSLIADQNTKIGTLVYKYEEPKPAYLGEVIVTVRIERDGCIHLICSELLGAPQEVIITR